MKGDQETLWPELKQMELPLLQKQKEKEREQMDKYFQAKQSKLGEDPAIREKLLRLRKVLPAK